MAKSDKGRTKMGNTPTCEDCGESLDHCTCDEDEGCQDCGCSPCACGEPCEGCGLDECECDGEGDENPSLFGPSEPVQSTLTSGFDREQYLRTKARCAELAANPALIAAALPEFMALLHEYETCIRSNDIKGAHLVNERADTFVAELQGGDGCGILAPEGAGSLLELAAAAPDGEIPMWGQCGNFVIQVGLTLIRVEWDGIFGLGFDIHAVKWDRPFPSETGYRSFAGCDIAYGTESLPLNWSVADFVRRAIEEYIKRDCKKGLPFIAFEYQDRHAGDAINALPLAVISPESAPVRPVEAQPIPPRSESVEAVCLPRADAGSQLSLFA